ncbi:MAG: hemerythrin domain-containing protein [Acidobacteria bacterium]|nr:hemerythrin domain-containing protein [Acidobacteriota bacterium]MCB9397499.1 hemerythrin domain-containing protein [Acidobacteriota bacterium]
MRPQIQDEPEPQTLTTLDQIARNLLAAEKHHQREELALFPELEEVGLDGPCTLMGEEHVQLTQRKHELIQRVAQWAAGQSVQNRLRERIPDLIWTSTRT